MSSHPFLLVFHSHSDNLTQAFPNSSINSVIVEYLFLLQICLYSTTLGKLQSSHRSSLFPNEIKHSTSLTGQQQQWVYPPLTFILQTALYFILSYFIYAFVDLFIFQLQRS